MGLRYGMPPHWLARRYARTVQQDWTVGSWIFDRGADDASSSDINWVIMDYLVSEGYPGAAEKFAQETNMGDSTDTDNIRDRVRIRNTIHSGQIEEAIDLINEVDPQVCIHLSHLHPPCQMINSSIMHHSYAPRRLDDANSHFSPQYDLDIQPLRLTSNSGLPRIATLTY